MDVRNQEPSLIIDHITSHSTRLPIRRQSPRHGASGCACRAYAMPPSRPRMGGTPRPPRRRCTPAAPWGTGGGRSSSRTSCTAPGTPPSPNAGRAASRRRRRRWHCQAPRTPWRRRPRSRGARGRRTRRRRARTCSPPCSGPPRWPSWSRPRWWRTVTWAWTGTVRPWTPSAPPP